MAATPQLGLLFTFRLLPVISAELALRGIDARELITRAGLSADALRGELTAPLTRIQAFVDLAASTLGNEVFGLDLAERVPTGAYGLSEFLARSAPDLGSALAVLHQFAALINPAGKFELVKTSEGVSLHYSFATLRDTLGVHLNEYSIAYILRQGAAILGEQVPAMRAWFSHSRRGAVEAVTQRLGCPVTFGAADCGFALSHEVLARRPATADAALFQFLLSQARAQLSRVSTSDVVTQLIRVLEVRLGQGELSITAVASAMATTARSLQRHLGDAGTSYRDVLQHVRRRRRGELQHGGMSETQIANHLGFSDTHAMRRSLETGNVD